MEKLLFAKVREGAKIPTKRDEDAGRDLYACFDEDYMIIYPHTTALVPTGIATAFSSDYYAQILKCKNIGIKSLMDNNSVIDSGYRGERFVPITNCNDIPIIIIKDVGKAEELFPFSKKIVYPYSKGIAQFVMLPVPKFEEVEVSLEDLQNIKSERGSGKLGSSDK